MPIGFWAISRQEVKELVDTRFEQRYGRQPQHSKTYHQVIDRFVRDLPDILQDTIDGLIDNAVINGRSEGKLPSEGKVY